MSGTLPMRHPLRVPQMDWNSPLVMGTSAPRWARVSFKAWYWWILNFSPTAAKMMASPMFKMESPMRSR